jgi:hypothetical protein
MPTLHKLNRQFLDMLLHAARDGWYSFLSDECYFHSVVIPIGNRNDFNAKFS